MKASCRQPVGAALTYDPRSRRAWLDDDLDPRVAALELCTPCADRFVVPLGWSLDDRRDQVRRLWPDSELPAVETPRERGSSAGSGPVGADAPVDEHDRPDATVVELPLFDDDADAADADALGDQRRAKRTNRAVWFAPDDDGDVGSSAGLGASSPLLSRAFRSASG